MNIGRILVNHLLTNPSATVLCDLKISLSRQQLLDEVYCRALAYLGQSIKTGDSVVVVCGIGLTFWSDILALWVLGAVPVCLDKAPPKEHLDDIVNSTGALAYVAFEGSSLAFENLRSLELGVTDFDYRVNDLECMPWAELPHDGSALAAVICTSGTTGLPKAVPLDHRSIVHNALSTRGALGLSSSDRLLIATPFRFISSISHFVVTLLSGACFVGIESVLFGRAFIDTLYDLEITAFGGSPFHMRFIAGADSKILPKLRWAMSSGDHLPETVVDDIYSNFPNMTLMIVYGMVELGGRFCVMPPDEVKNAPGSVGLPLPGYEVAVLDERADPCATNEIGHIYTRGPFNFTGYLKNESATSKVLSHNGYRCGDMGYKDENGYLYISGRSDSVFKRSGIKVSAQVITDALISLSSVDDAFVIGKEDPIEGHVPLAYLVDGDNSLSKGQVLQYLRSVVPVNHLPKTIIRLPEIPRTGSGKVDRRKLAEIDGEQLS